MKKPTKTPTTARPKALAAGNDPIAAGTRKLEEMIARHVGAGVGGNTQVPGLAVARFASRGEAGCYLFEPSLCMAAQGSKRVTLGDTSYHYDEHTFLLTAVDLPTIVQIERASEAAPYASLQIFLDLDIARQLIADMELHGHESTPTDAGMVTAPVTEDLLDPVLRLVGLLSRPQEIPILAPGIHREILYRLLISPAGDRLREIVRLGTQSNRAAKAIMWLRKNFTRPLSIEELARETGMGVSTLHHHFKAVTNMSPLQYQKNLRLHEARRLMLTENFHAGVAAQEVGYESVTQFNREYRRLSAHRQNAMCTPCRQAEWLVLADCGQRVISSQQMRLCFPKRELIALSLPNCIHQALLSGCMFR